MRKNNVTHAPAYPKASEGVCAGYGFNPDDDKCKYMRVADKGSFLFGGKIRAKNNKLGEAYFVNNLPDGKSGGRPDMAQAGGPKPENVKEALDKLAKMI